MIGSGVEITNIAGSVNHAQKISRQARKEYNHAKAYTKTVAKGFDPKQVLKPSLYK